jgi:hypothetical protein
VTASAFVKIHCDWPDCYARIETYKTRVTEARKSVAGHGWKYVSGFDLCGSREQAEQYITDHDLRALKGHATREDHGPVIKPAVKGYVKLSCLCGWVYASSYSWERPGEVARTSADFRWRAHVKEALAS